MTPIADALKAFGRSGNRFLPPFTMSSLFLLARAFDLEHLG
jgi:hypothetical protein